MSLLNRLTKGALGHILEGKQIQEPIFQMLAYKNMPTDNNKRYRLSLNDGAYIYQCCIIVGDLAEKIETQEYDRYCLLKVKRYMLNEIQNKSVIVLADIQLLVKGSEINERLGDPHPYGSPAAPPLSRFEPNYHVNQMEMDVEFDDSFDGIDSGSNKNANRNQASAKSKQASSNPQQSAQSLNPELAVPISSITPYSNKWVIKGRITAKSTKRSWSNAKGDGTLFSFDLKDESGDIRITAFKAECDKYFDYIKVGEVYLVSKGAIKIANKQYSRSTSDYEITLTPESIVELCNDETNCPVISYDFKQFDQLDSNFGGFTDIIGVLKHVEEIATVIQKNTKKELLKRDIVLVDMSKSEINLTLWGDVATNFAAELEDIIVIRGVRVSEYNGLSLSTSSNSTIEINPDLDEVNELKGWYTRLKGTFETNKLTKQGGGGGVANWGNLSEINTDKIQTDDKVILRTKAVINQVGKANMYKGCTKSGCNKKLTDLNNGMFRCEKCNEETDKFEYRIITTFSIADHMKNVWVQAFSEESKFLLGKDRDFNQLGQLFDENQTEFEEIIRSINFKPCIFKLRAKMEHFNDENRIRTQVLQLNEINYQEYGNYLLDSIRQN